MYCRPAVHSRHCCTVTAKLSGSLLVCISYPAGQDASSQIPAGYVPAPGTPRYLQLSAPSRRLTRTDSPVVLWTKGKGILHAKATS
eukprot:3453574-Rhodomonas_salina.3